MAQSREMLASPSTAEEQAAVWWRAVLARDARFDGVFVYAVRSTGVYCRPSCPSRRPGRDKVLFFARPEEAAQAGYRPCRRCRPLETSPQAALVREACRYLDERQDERVTLGELASHLRVSPYHLLRTFKRLTGLTPRQYAEAGRLARVKSLLRQGNGVTEALYDAGYGSSSRFYQEASARLGMTPRAYRRGGQGMRIGYTIVDSPLGRLLVAATERGVCAVYLGESDAALEEALRREYPRAELFADSEGLGRWVRALLDHLEGRLPHLELPLDVQATAFQWRVWELLRQIPYGSTRTYSQLARELGRPGAARAVARACATNPVALVIPCHRAVRADGDLAGYRWGVERKSALLERERALSRGAGQPERAEGG